MPLTGWSGISDLDILVLLDVGALYSQLAGLGVKVNSLHAQCESSAHPGAAHTPGGGLCLHLPAGTGDRSLSCKMDRILGKFSTETTT